MTAKQNKALAALITAPTVAAAAEQAGIGYTTLRRWIKTDDAFRHEYERELAGLVTEAATRAKQAMSPALAVLREIVEDEDGPAAVRVSAARSLLEYGMKLVETEDILKRLAELERQREEDQDARPN